MQANVERSHTDECPASGAAAHNGRPPRSLGRTDESACARERGGRRKHLGRLVEGHPRARAPAQGAAADRRQRSAARAEAVGVGAVLRAGPSCLVIFFVDYNTWAFSCYVLAQDRAPWDVCYCSGSASAEALIKHTLSILGSAFLSIRMVSDTGGKILPNIMCAKLLCCCSDFASSILSSFILVTTSNKLKIRRRSRTRAPRDNLLLTVQTTLLSVHYAAECY